MTLAFLFRAVKARRPETSQGILITAVVGAVLAALGGLAYAILITEQAHEFATHGTQTYPQANTLLSSAAVAILQYAGLLGSLLLAVGFVLVALNAMRVGLLTQFLGYLGIAAAAASLLLIGSAPALLIEVFWLLAVGYLLAGRWPNGDPPAWRTGEAVPWPANAECASSASGATPARRPAAPSRHGRPTVSPPTRCPLRLGRPGRRPPSASASGATRRRFRERLPLVGGERPLVARRGPSADPPCRPPAPRSRLPRPIRQYGQEE